MTASPSRVTPVLAGDRRDRPASIAWRGRPVPRLVSVASSLPDRVVTSDELERAITDAPGGLRIPSGIIVATTGVEQRRWRAEGQQCSDLAATAGRRALASAGLAPEDVDVLVFASASQDQAEPATAAVVQHLVGAERAHVFDVKNACSSFVTALDLAGTAVAGGRADVVLVTVGEVLSPTVELQVGTPDALVSALPSLTLGDAGAGAVVASETVVDRLGGGIGAAWLYPGHFVADGRHWRTSVVASGGSRGWAEPRLRCDGGALATLARRHVPRVVHAALDQIGWTLDEVDLVFPHQPSAALVHAVADALGVHPDRLVTVLRTTGNTASATVPLSLATALTDGRCRPGSKALLVVGAGGFTAGCVPVAW